MIIINVEGALNGQCCKHFMYSHLILKRAHIPNLGTNRGTIVMFTFQIKQAHNLLKSYNC